MEGVKKLMARGGFYAFPEQKLADIGKFLIFLGRKMAEICRYRQILGYPWQCLMAQDNYNALLDYFKIKH